MRRLVLCVDMAISALGASVGGAHLHDGAPGEAGPPIVHTGDHPEGAVRGQLAVASVFDRTLDR